ncbi:hypothetical protein M1D49_07925 [Bacillus sp. PK3-056]|uniref:hypothetical protein n=1 Tax=Niallia circulans TaxID=1397 RepID=UPI000F45B713|nr:hypothetical protein [Niallia circulans]AYV74287.1 hypothetical protein C2H98_23510 [Niallia circulans]
MSQFKFGMDAIEETNASGGGSTGGGEFAKLPSGTSLKVKLTGLDNIMRYYGYGVYKRVNTFIAKNPSDRNEKGFVEANHTPWDLASKYYYDKAYEMVKDVTDEDEIKAIKESKAYKDLSTEGYKYSGKARFAIGFIDIEVGKEILLDFTAKQFNEAIKPSLVKFDGKKDKVAFEISKQGSGTKTAISLMPVLDMDDDLTDKERANFEKFVGKEFNVKLFEGLLFEADEKTQTENLVAAGFDISLIGLTVGAGAQASENEGAEDPTKAF